MDEAMWTLLEQRYRRWYAEHDSGGYCLLCGRYGPCRMADEARVWLVSHDLLSPTGQPMQGSP